MYRLPYLTCLLTFAFVSVSFAQSPYTITDLGTLADCGSAGYAINARGQVTGVSQRRALLEGHLWCVGPWDTFLISSPYTTMIDLGRAIEGSSINASGQIAGRGFTPGYQTHAFLISPSYSSVTDLGTLGGDFSQALGINDSGQVAGNSTRRPGDDTTYDSRAFLISPPYTSMTDLGTLGRYNGHEASWVSGINSSGQVVGFSYSIYHLPSDPAWPSRHAFVISPPYTNMIDLGTLPGGDSGSSASGINDAGQITGTSFGQTSTGFHAFLMSPPYTAMADLGTLPSGMYSAATGINNRGQVVGYASVGDTPTTASGIHHPFLYTPGCGMADVTTLLPGGSGWTFPIHYYSWTFPGYHVFAINDAGQITGSGTPPGSVDSHAFVITPPNTDLAIGVSAATDVKKNRNLSYAITVANNGPNHAACVTVTDTLPSGTTLVSAQSTQGTCTGATTVTCSLGTIASSGGASIKVVVNVSKAPVGTTISNTATVTGNVTDPNTANDTSRATTSVSQQRQSHP